MKEYMAFIAMVVLGVAAIAYFVDNPDMQKVDAEIAAEMGEIAVSEAAEMSSMKIAERERTQPQRLMLAKVAYVGGGVTILVIMGIAVTAWGITAVHGWKVATLPPTREIGDRLYITKNNGVTMLVDALTMSAVPLSDARQVSELRGKMLMAINESDNKRDALIGIAQGTNDPTTAHYLLDNGSAN